MYQISMPRRQYFVVVNCARDTCSQKSSPIQEFGLELGCIRSACLVDRRIDSTVQICSVRQWWADDVGSELGSEGIATSVIGTSDER
jgi:hypothetical protein